MSRSEPSITTNIKRVQRYQKGEALSRTDWGSPTLRDHQVKTLLKEWAGSQYRKMESRELWTGVSQGTQKNRGCTSPKLRGALQQSSSPLFRKAGIGSGSQTRIQNSEGMAVSVFKPG